MVKRMASDFKKRSFWLINYAHRLVEKDDYDGSKNELLHLRNMIGI
jgi:hypothetical protein